MLKRFTVELPAGVSHIYLEPNMPKASVIETLNEKYPSGWKSINYHHNKIMQYKQGGTAGINPYLLATQKVAEGTGRVLSKAGKTLWESGEDVAPYLWSGAKKAGNKIGEVVGSFSKDISNYSLTKAEQFKKYRLLKTKKAKKLFSKTIDDFNKGVLQYKGKTVTSLRKAVNLAMDRATLLESQMKRSLSKGERGMIVFDKFDVPSEAVYEDALRYRMFYPVLWESTGVKNGDIAFHNLSRAIKRGYWLDSEEWMYSKWKQHESRFSRNKTARGVINNLKWITYGNQTPAGAKKIIEDYVEKHPKFAGNQPWLTPIMEKGGAIEKEIDGGYEYRGNAEVRASKTDLITLPADVKGTNCFNCTYHIKNNDKEGYCWHPEVDLPVTYRMCCALWDHPEVERSWSRHDLNDVIYEKGGDIEKYWENRLRNILQEKGQAINISENIVSAKDPRKNMDKDGLIQEYNIATLDRDGNITKVYVPFSSQMRDIKEVMLYPAKINIFTDLSPQADQERFFRYTLDNLLFPEKMARGGMSYGPTHEQGGIKYKVESTGQVVELEGAGVVKDKKGELKALKGGEGVVNVKNMMNKKKFILTQPLTLGEMVSCANEVDGNGVNFRESDTPCPIKKMEDGGDVNKKPPYKKNQAGLKYSSDQYRNINGVHFVNWTSNPDEFEEEISKAKQQGLKTKIIKGELYIEERPIKKMEDGGMFKNDEIIRFVLSNDRTPRKAKIKLLNSDDIKIGQYINTGREDRTTLLPVFFRIDKIGKLGVHDKVFMSQDEEYTKVPSNYSGPFVIIEQIKL